MKNEIYNLTKVEIFNIFKTSETGLLQEEAENRIEKYGKNIVQKKENWSWFSILVGQFNDALVWILVVAGILAFIFGEAKDGIIIFLIISINAFIGFFQEYRAEKTLENIRKIAVDKAIILRDGEKVEIDSSLLVPGDVMLLSAGDTIAADAYIIEGYDINVNEFIFTGESKPSKKIIGAIAEKNIGIVDVDNIFFTGTSLISGSAKAVVVATGMETELGKLAKLVSEVAEDETPLQKQMRILGRDVSVIAILIAIIIMISGYIKGTSTYENFLFALALSVSVVPEGLPAAISVALSLGMKKLLKDNVLAKKMLSVETLASVNIICTDKTGTITKNELMVTDIVFNDFELAVDGNGYENKGNFKLEGNVIEHKKNQSLEEILQIGFLCNSSGLSEENGIFKIAGDPTEGALIVVAQKYIKDEKYFSNYMEKITEIPFSSERMRMNVVFADKKDNTKKVFVKGSPDIIIDICKYKKINGEISLFSEEEKEKIKHKYNLMSEKALRVLAFASRDVSNFNSENILVESDRELVWHGMMGMIDPPREDVKDAIIACHKSGIKVVMITGDYEVTAKAIAEQAGLLEGKDEAFIINGKMLKTISDDEIFKKIKEKEVIFARISPEQKLRIANIIKNNGYIMAMTGDGVNDAPALKRADIGIAMGIMGTDVSKEASDMILLDDKFSSIVNAIKQGRTIYQNLKKFVYYVFSSNVSEFFTVVGASLMGIPAPITAVQILAIDLGTDILPSFSLSFEPSEPNIMRKKPFSNKEKIIDKAMTFRLIWIGFLMATGAILSFIISMKSGGWNWGNKIDTQSVLYMRSTTVAYAVLSMTQMSNLLQARSQEISVFKIGFLKNKFAIISIFISIGMLLFFMYNPFIQKYLHMTPILFRDWMMVIIFMVIIFIVEEIRKMIIRNKSKNYA